MENKRLSSLTIGNKQKGYGVSLQHHFGETFVRQRGRNQMKIITMRKKEEGIKIIGNKQSDLVWEGVICTLFFLPPRCFSLSLLFFFENYIFICFLLYFLDLTQVALIKEDRDVSTNLRDGCYSEKVKLDFKICIFLIN